MNDAVVRVFVQLEDAEMATAAAIKARKGMEMELQDLQAQFEALSKSKQEVCICVMVSDVPNEAAVICLQCFQRFGYVPCRASCP